MTVRQTLVWHPDFLAETMDYLKDVIHQSIPGHQGLKSSTKWPRTLEEALFPARTWSWSLYRPMTASAGLRMVKFRQRGSLGSWVALQPQSSSSERVNMALVCWDSAGDGPARGNGWTGGGGLWEVEVSYVWGPEWGWRAVLHVLRSRDTALALEWGWLLPAFELLTASCLKVYIKLLNGSS